MKIAEFLNRLVGLKKSVNGWQACCPAHDDKKASLSIKESLDGKILLNCKAGCKTESVVAALELTMKDLFPPRTTTGEPKPRIVDTYDYTDEDGKLLFQTVRFEPKDFRQCRPDPVKPGQCLWNLAGVRRVLYRLPGIKAAVLAGLPIYVAEGEKDCDALAKNGFAATCNPMGADKWLSEHTESLRGAAIVVVIADKDAPGRKHAQSVARSLCNVAKCVKMLELPDSQGKPVKDAADFFAAGGSADELQAIVNAAPEFAPASGPRSFKPGSGAREYLGAEAHESEWRAPKPLPDDLPPVQSFNIDCLPDILRLWIKDISERMQCPVDYPAVGATIALGSVIGRKIGICPKRQDDWLVVPNLWGMAIGRPGLMKSPALEQALAPLNRLVAQALAKYEAESGAHKVSAMLEAQRTKLSEKAIWGLLKEGDEKGARELAESNLEDADTAPVLRRYKVNDSTVEKLGELLNQNPNGLLLHRDELVGFLLSLDKEGREDSRAFFLEAWNGTGDFTSDRIGRGTVRIEAITVSIIGAIQPGPLSEYLRQAVRSGVGDDGLLQRFQLAVWPDASKEWRNIDRWPDSAAKNDAFAAFQYLDTLTPASVGADGSNGIPFLRFAPDAQERFDQWRAELEKNLRSDCNHPAFEAHLAKYRKLVPALALILHLVDRGTGPVTLAALERALSWASYLESHARRIYSAVLRPDTAAARELAKHLKRGELPERFTLRETYRKGWTGLSTKEDAEAATEVLCDLDWIRPAADTARTTGRTGGLAFETNPKILNSPRNELPELTKPTSVSFVSEVYPTVEKSRNPQSEEKRPLHDEKPDVGGLVEEFA